MHKFNILYRTTCLLNNKFYIGAHSTNELEDGYLGSGLRLQRSIEKYGKENHVREILNHYEDKDSLYSAEKDIVNEELRSDPNCLNLMDGGKGGFISREQQSYRSSCAGKASWNKIISNPELLEKHKMESSLRFKNLHKEGKFKYDNFSDKTHSEKSKKLISDKAKLRLGDKNSSFGTCWIYNEVENKKVNKLDLETYLSSGWIKGRKMKFNKE